MMYGRLSVASRAALTIFVGILLGCAADEQDGQLLVIDASIVVDANGQLDTGPTDSELSDTMSSRDARIVADLALATPVDAAIRRCQTPGPAWEPGVPAFRKVTDAWGLAGVEGEYLSVTDVDGDHWPDLIVRKGGGVEDFSQNGIRHKWVLRNNGRGRFEDPTKRSRLFASRLNPAPSFGRPGKVIVSFSDLNIGFFKLPKSNTTRKQ